MNQQVGLQAGENTKKEKNLLYGHLSVIWTKNLMNSSQMTGRNLSTQGATYMHIFFGIISSVLQIQPELSIISDSNLRTT